MDTILQGLMDLSGVRATMVLDGTGQLVAHRGHAVYDRALCQQVGATVMKAIESIQLQQEDWETLSAQYSDGRILLRRVSAKPGGPRHLIAVVADTSLNASFATVALRVAANKVRSAIEGGTSSQLGSQAAAAGSQPLGPPSASSSVLPPAAGSQPNLANTGLTWSKSSSSSVSGQVAPTSSAVPVADPASSAFLTRCATELARHVGPMAKVYVQESVRRVSPDAPFSIALARQLVDDLAAQIEDAKDRSQFRKATLEKK
jgi:predicted regulator of Ras-like GTPase activity (Roadblock/LC7/MglB family)